MDRPLEDTSEGELQPAAPSSKHIADSDFELGTSYLTEARRLSATSTASTIAYSAGVFLCLSRRSLC